MNENRPNYISSPSLDMQKKKGLFKKNKNSQKANTYEKNYTNKPYYNTNTNPYIQENKGQQNPFESNPFSRGYTDPFKSVNAYGQNEYFNVPNDMNFQNMQFNANTNANNPQMKQPVNVQNTQNKAKQKPLKKDKPKVQSNFVSFIKWIFTPKNSTILALFVVMPILFILSVYLKYTMIKYAFIISCIIASIWLVWKKLYSDGVRLILLVSYISLMAVTIINLITGIDPILLTKNTIKTSVEATEIPYALDTENEVRITPQATTPEPINNYEGESVKVLTQFMEYWKVGNIEEMIVLTSPSWKQSFKEPTQALFNLLSNRRPKEYEYENISGSDNDVVRTATLNASINKFTSDEYMLIRYQILLLKENGQWYVDPSSLATNIKPTDTPDPNATPAPTDPPRTTVTPKPDPSTLLYYNTRGGSLYHVDPNCKAVDEKYLPLDGQFTYEHLHSAPYSSLKPCLVCGAPTN